MSSPLRHLMGLNPLRGDCTRIAGSPAVAMGVVAIVVTLWPVGVDDLTEYAPELALGSLPALGDTVGTVRVSVLPGPEPSGTTTLSWAVLPGNCTKSCCPTTAPGGMMTEIVEAFASSAALRGEGEERGRRSGRRRFRLVGKRVPAFIRAPPSQ